MVDLLGRGTMVDLTPCERSYSSLAFLRGEVPEVLRVPRRRGPGDKGHPPSTSLGSGELCLTFETEVMFWLTFLEGSYD